MAWTRTYEESEPQRINKWLAQSGEQVEDAGRKILQGQTLTLTEKAEGRLEGFTAVLNKPVGFVSGQPEPGYIPAVRLLTREALVGDAVLIPDSRMSLPPLGRLDLDSHGLLILSNDGVLAKAVIGPQSELDKEYIVRVAGRIDPPKIALLRQGLELDGRALKPAQVTANGQVLRFVLTEGRNRQIRRMCELLDLRVMDLLRVRIGPLNLGDLPEGRWRVLSASERQAMIAASQGR